MEEKTGKLFAAHTLQNRLVVRENEDILGKERRVKRQVGRQERRVKRQRKNEERTKDQEASTRRRKHKEREYAKTMKTEKSTTLGWHST